MSKNKTVEEPLQVYPTRDEAEANLPRYARLCKDWGLVPKCRVKAAPMERGHYKGTWGVWLVRHL